MSCLLNALVFVWTHFHVYIVHANDKLCPVQRSEASEPPINQLNILTDRPNVLTVDIDPKD